MNFTARTLWLLRHYWANQLDVSPSAFDANKPIVGQTRLGGVQLFCHNDAAVLGAPDSRVSIIEQEVSELKALNIKNSDAVHSWD